MVVSKATTALETEVNAAEMLAKSRFSGVGEAVTHSARAKVTMVEANFILIE